MRLFLLMREVGTLRVEGRVRSLWLEKMALFFCSATTDTEVFSVGSLLGWGMAGQMV